MKIEKPITGIINIQMLPQPKERARTLKSGHSYTPKNTVEAEEFIVDEAINQLIKQGITEPIENAVFELAILVLLPKPKCWYQGKLPLIGDVDNYAKLVQDALNKILYTDDRYIIGLQVEKRYTPDIYTDISGYYIRFNASPIPEKKKKPRKSKKIQNNG